MEDRIILVSCVGRKQAVSAPAKDLYTSVWFLKARRFAEQVGCRWFILSAEHGLVNPEGVLAPYEKTLNRMSAVERRAWSEKVFEQLISAAPDAGRIVFLAGARYREFLVEPLQERGVIVDVPMRGLKIGEQLAWLGERNRDEQPSI